MTDYTARAHEETTRKNINAIKDFTQGTRQIVRDLEVKVNNYEAQNRQLANKIAQLETQLNQIKVRVYSGAATSN